MMVRVLAEEQKARLRKIDRQAWMREESDGIVEKRPIRPAGVILAILVLAVFGQMVLV